jgi:PPK2 family polyphosphate:nucleotide phosphotransferase
MTIHSKAYLAPSGKTFNLSEWPTAVPALSNTKKRFKRIFEEHGNNFSKLQQVHYASNRLAHLMIFQGMENSGKDGSRRHILCGTNPQGCEVISFRQPNAETPEHGFLSRSARRLPERGRIGIFNRSRCGGISQQQQHDKSKWNDRYHCIAGFEKHLDRNSMRIVIIFLHLPKDEQHGRFLARVDDPDKSWKLMLDDTHERMFWKDHVKAYEVRLSATSTSHAPWFVDPAGDKDNSRLIVSRIVLDALWEPKPFNPRITRRPRAEWGRTRKTLVE